MQKNLPIPMSTHQRQGDTKLAKEPSQTTCHRVVAGERVCTTQNAKKNNIKNTIRRKIDLFPSSPQNSLPSETFRDDLHTANSRTSRKANSLGIYQLFARHCLNSVRPPFTLCLNGVGYFGLCRANTWAMLSKFASRLALEFATCGSVFTQCSQCQV